MSVMGRASWKEWVDEYALSHRHPINRICHTIGIPMIAASIILFPVGLLLPVFRYYPVALFVLGWTLQFVGHAFEKKPPEFLKDWRFLFVGLRWWMAKLQGRA